MENYCFLEETPVGRLCIAEAEGCITGVTWGEPPADAVWEETPLLQSCKEELRSFFRGEKKTFDLPLYCKGTAFQQQVWAALREIPYGETRTYGEIAAAIGRPKAARAVGMANHRNPIAILIPCHRVIGAKGKLTGYAGGIEKKEWLLQLEQQHKDF